MEKLWIPCEYKLDEATIKIIIQEFPDGMKVPIPNEEIAEEEADREVLRDALRRETKGKVQEDKS